MNAERLRYLVERLLERERGSAIQKKLNNLVSALEQLTNSPQDAGIQNAVSANLAELNRVVKDDFYDELTPASRDHFLNIGAGPFFSGALIDDLRDAVVQNAMTPAVAAETARLIRDARHNFVQTLEKIRDGLSGVGVEADDLEEGQADIAFLIPRDLFKNHLGGLSKELAVIDKIVRFFSEAATGQAEESSLKTISTTDPVITLGVSIATIAMIGRSITWLLDTWKKSLEIKDLREKSKSVGLTEKELKVFDDKIEKLVNKAVSERIKAMLAEAPVDQLRKNELEKGLDWSLRALLARIERGMSVEIRLIPPQPPSEEDAEEEVPVNPHFENMQQIARDLVFPKPSGEPVIALPGAPPGDGAEQRA